MVVRPARPEDGVAQGDIQQMIWSATMADKKIPKKPLDAMTRAELYDVIASVGIHYEDDGYTFCPWCGNTARDDNGNWKEKNEHDPNCPQTQAALGIQDMPCAKCGKTWKEHQEITIRCDGFEFMMLNK